jgi:hypothetical protein
LIDAAILVVDEAGPGIAAFESSYQVWLHERKSRMNRSGKGAMNHDFNIYRRTVSPCVVRFNGAQIDLATLTRHQMTEVLGVLRGACFAIVAGLAGMRISELRSLKRGCLIRSELRDGRVLLKIAGTLFKTSASAQGEPAEWVAGWDEPDNPIRSAIDTLSVLSPQHEEPYLFGAKANALRVVGNEHLNGFVHRFANAVGLDREWHFHAHQFRKTFARFIVLSGPNAALSLMRHFKHVSIQMTEKYFPNDPELMNDLIEASEELIAERLDSVFGSDRLAGIKGEQIVSRNAGYRGAAGDAARKDLVKMTMTDPMFRALLHVYGICLYEKEKAKCQDDIANVGLETCIECPNAIIEESNLPFWVEQVEVIRANIAARADGVVDLDMYRQLERAERVVTKLSA